MTKRYLPNFSCHSLRHTFTTRLCKAGTNIKLMQGILGHQDISTTVDIKYPHKNKQCPSGPNCITLLVEKFCYFVKRLLSLDKWDNPWYIIIKVRVNAVLFGGDFIYVVQVFYWI